MLRDIDVLATLDTKVKVDPEQFLRKLHDKFIGEKIEVIEKDGKYYKKENYGSGFGKRSVVTDELTEEDYKLYKSIEFIRNYIHKKNMTW